MTRCTAGKNLVFCGDTLIGSYYPSRTASEVKLKKVQGSMIDRIAGDTSRLGANFISIDMSNTTVEESADRALSGVVRKLGQSESVEFTVNRLVAEATDISNLSKMYPR